MLHRGSLIYAMLVFLAGASLTREAATGRLARVDERWWAFMSEKATPKAAAQGAVLVEITSDTLSKHPWPWGPDDFALFFHAALPFQPAVLAAVPPLHFERPSASEEDPVFTKMLHNHVLRSPKLVLGGALGFATDSNALQELQPMPVLRNVHGDLTRIPDFAAVESWADELFRLTTQPGWTNVPERTGPRGWCPLVLRYRGQPVPTMALQMLMHMEKATPDEVAVVLGPRERYISVGKSRMLPIDESGRMPLNPGATFTRVSYDDLLLAREQIDRKETPVFSTGLINGRAVILARTDTDSRTIEMPGGRKLSHGELVCTALASIELGAFPRRIGSWFDWSLIGAAAVAALSLRKWRPMWCIGITLLLLACCAGGAWWAFREKHVLLPALLPSALAVWVLLLRLVARRIEKIIAF